MFDVNFINEPGIQDAGINKKLNYHIENEDSQKTEQTASLNDKNKETATTVDSSKEINTSIAPLVIAALLTLYLVGDYIGVLPKEYSFIDNVVNSKGKVVDRDNYNVYKTASEYVDIINTYNNVSSVTLNEKSINLQIDYDNILRLEQDRIQILNNYELSESNVFVKQGTNLFSIIISSMVMNNNDRDFFSEAPKNVGIVSGMSKNNFISILKKQIDSKNIFSSSLDVIIINKENQSIVIPR